MVKDLHQEQVVLSVLPGLHLLGQDKENIQHKFPLEQADQFLMKGGSAVGVLGTALHDGLGAEQIAEQMEDQLDGKMVSVGTGTAGTAERVGQEGNKDREETISPTAAVFAGLVAAVFGAGMADVGRVVQKEPLVFHEGLGLTKGIVAKTNLFLDDARCRWGIQ